MKRVLLDTNMLLLSLVGNKVSGWENWKRLQDFDSQDLKRLNRETANSRHITLPNILTEASNLLGAKAQEGVRDGWLLLQQFIASAEEIFRPSCDVVLNPIYKRLGLTDAAIADLATSGVRVVTVDIELANRLGHAGVDVVNLRHYKTPRRRK